MWKQWSTKTLVLLYGTLAVRIKSDPFGVIISKTRKVSLRESSSRNVVLLQISINDEGIFRVLLPVC